MALTKVLGTSPGAAPAAPRASSASVEKQQSFRYRLVYLISEDSVEFSLLQVFETDIYTANYF